MDDFIIVIFITLLIVSIIGLLGGFDSKKNHNQLTNSPVEYIVQYHGHDLHCVDVKDTTECDFEKYHKEYI